MPVLYAYFLVGPTAVGKSAVVQWIAEQHGYDILAADSMQVYRGMDIGTAKPDFSERSRVHHHGLDLADPSDFFSAWSYRQSAISVLAESQLNDRRTIVAGGTGLYVKSLVDGLDEIPAADPARRLYWMELYEAKGLQALQDALRSVDESAYEELADKQNSRRLIRALERFEAGGGQPLNAWADQREYAPLACLMLPAEALRERIALRVHKMYRDGLVEEVKGMLGCGVALSDTARKAIGYAEVIDLISGRCSREDAIARTVVRTRQLAKRQRTWFRHQLNVRVIDITADMQTEEIAQRVLEHWRLYGPTEIAGERR